MSSHARRLSSSSVQYQNYCVGHSNPILGDHDDTKIPSINTLLLRAKRRMRSRQFLLFFGLLTFVSFTIWFLRTPPVGGLRSPEARKTVGRANSPNMATCQGRGAELREKIGDPVEIVGGGSHRIQAAIWHTSSTELR
jgi:hypothetical protein